MKAPQRSIRVGMQTIRSPRRMSAWSRLIHQQGVTIGLVPTMGALHAGHLSLIRKARLSCDAVVVSLFINPRQFGPREDLATYPMRFQADSSLCRKAGVDVLFAPTRQAMYPPDFLTTVTIPGLSECWEGKFRPAHFQGVTTIVTKLLALVRPGMVFLGQKDFQQAVLVKRLIADLNLGVRLVVCPTVREGDGLAKSSRNEYLTPQQRKAAPILAEALMIGRKAIRSGIREGVHIRRAMEQAVKTEPLAHMEYLAVCDPMTLRPLTRLTPRVVLLGAIRIGRVRLIDNLLVMSPTSFRSG